MRVRIENFKVHGAYVVRFEHDDGRAIDTTYGYSNRAHVGAFCAGARACWEGKPRRSPYADTSETGNTMRSGRAGRYAFRNAWLHGWNNARALQRQQEPITAPRDRGTEGEK